MRLLVKARRRSAVRAPFRKVLDRVPYQHRLETLTAVMAASGMGGGGRHGLKSIASKRETLALEAVKLAVELGADVNAVNTDGRTALDAARASRFNSVVAFLQEKGAKAGTGAPPRGGRGQ